MTKACKILLLVACLFVLFATPSAFADSANMYLAGAGNNTADGVYIGPYTGTINGGPDVPIICDDFSHDSYIGESWTANVSSLPSLSDVRFNPANYDQVAYLATILFGLGNDSSAYAEADAIQFAIWSINDPTDVNAAIGSNACFGSAAYDCVSYWLAQAANQTWTPGEFSNILFYTPTSGGNPQEFIAQTPEPGIALLLCIGLVGVFTLKRRHALGQVA